MPVIVWSVLVVTKPLVEGISDVKAIVPVFLGKERVWVVYELLIIPDL